MNCKYIRNEKGISYKRLNEKGFINWFNKNKTGNFKMLPVNCYVWDNNYSLNETIENLKKEDNFNIKNYINHYYYYNCNDRQAGLYIKYYVQV